MRRFALLLSVSALAFASACSDRSTAPMASPEGARQTVEGPGQAACVKLSESEIRALIDSVYVNGSPDEQAALSKWENIVKQRAAGDREELIKEKILDLVDFTLRKSNEDKLSASEDELAAMLNSLFCYGGMADDYFYGGGGGKFIYPLDAKQTIVAKDGRAAITFEDFPVDRPTLITISLATDTLDTNLDKYPRVYEFSKYPSDAVLMKAAVTEVCAEAPASVFPHLALGHNSSVDGFEILDAPANYTSVLTECDPPLQTGLVNSLGDRLLQMVLPKKLYAAAMMAGGGIAGTVDNLSPIGPIDPRIRVTKITTGTSAPIGGTITPSPSVLYRTAGKNKLLADITTAFTTTSGAILPGLVTSQASGIAATTSWTLGTTAGEFTATATPQSTGPVAVENAYFVDENFAPTTSVTFLATATPPAKVVVTQAPTVTTGNTFQAGVTHTPRTIVQVQDASNRVVPAYKESITMNAAAGGIVQPFLNPASVEAQTGEAIFETLAITKAGTFVISPSATYNGELLPVVGAYPVIITPGAPIIEKIAGDGQTADAGTILGVASGTVAPRVRVRDIYNNLWTDRPVYWQTFDGGIIGSTANTTSTSTSLSTPTGNPSGEASTTWTIGGLTNELFASLTPGGVTGNDYVVFTATGNRDRTVQSCAIGTGRESAITNVIRWRDSRLPSRISSLELYLSITGNAGKDRVPVDVRLIAYESTEISRGVWSTPVERANVLVMDAPLKGNAADDAPVSFSFGANGYVPTPGTRLTFRLFKIEGGDNGTLRFNTGNCNSSPLETVLLSTGALVRNSVAFQLR